MDLSKRDIVPCQPWLRSARFDLLWIIGPGIIAVLICFYLPAAYRETRAESLVGWVILVLLVDVAHVYSTLFRTYWNKRRFRAHRTLYLFIPVACYITGVLLYAAGAMLFWSALAYLAVFHFIRQQYGFMRLYARGTAIPQWSRNVDALMIYAATLYPLIYWHCTPGRNFSWFMEGDFVPVHQYRIKNLALVVYLLILAAYVGKECTHVLKGHYLNIPKNLLVAVTAGSWYLGIVYFNGDLAFTLLNVVTHGIPYMALIWLHQRNEEGLQAVRPLFRFMRLAGFILVLFFLAYLEEGFWDGLVWREHQSVFPAFQNLPQIDRHSMLIFLVPLLSLPQSTHYMLDAFIWRKSHDPSV